MSTLERAIEISARAHAGQIDKAGAPYVLHPIRVMLTVQSLVEQMVAALHDVVEDTGVTLEDLRREGFPDEVIMAVDALTRRPNETYDDFVLRVRENPIARVVKLADIEDNLDQTRIANPTHRDRERFARYERARDVLSQTRGGTK